jgi:glycosyltransferase involved in cell wall biosynthesis
MTKENPVRLWVVVPAYNEQRWIASTLRSMADQRDHDFTVLVVDNASDDGTSDVVRRFADQHPDLDLRVIGEEQKGTGAACDTGIRYAISHGATHIARTDADCLAAPDWTVAVKNAFADGYQMAGGRLRVRVDDFPVSLWQRMALATAVRVGTLAARFRPDHRGPDFLGPYVLCAGCNCAFTAELYLRCGGYPRVAFEEEYLDRELSNRARRLTRSYGRRSDMVVFYSTRRIKAWGMRKTWSWYTAHGDREQKMADVR